MNRAMLIAATALIVGAACVPAGDVLADQAEEDAVLAERLFEQRRRASEIVEWARERAENAVRNSPTGLAQQTEAEEHIAQCIAKWSELDPDSSISDLHEQRCRLEAGVIFQPDKSVVRSLTDRFIKERLDQESDEIEKELLDYLKQLLPDAEDATGDGQKV